MQAVAQLAAYNIKELHLRRGGSGSRQIDDLYAACSSSGLISSPATDVRSRYECVFDAALSSHFGVWLIDYVEEVCGDSTLLSNDPAEAQLLDGKFVRSWCEKTLHGIEAGVVAALKSDQLFMQYLAQQLHKDLSKVSVLLSVLQALQRIRSAGWAERKAATAGHGVDDERKQAELLQKCLQVMTWCARRAFQDQPHTGRFASVPAWMRQVHRRRDKAPPGWSLFLDDLLQSLQIIGAYPFSSLQNMLYMLFIAIRETDQQARESKLSLLMYYLLDLDFLQPGQQDDFCSAFSVSPAKVACWQATFLLDCIEQPPASSTQTAADTTIVIDPQSEALLSRACELLSRSALGTTPFKVIQALVALGRADAALSLHWAHTGITSGTSSTTDLSQAVTLLDLRLRCGLLAEAFLAMRSHCRLLPSPQRAQHAEALVVHLLEWAAAQTASPASTSSQHVQERQGNRSALQVLCELPWDSAEEDVLVAWVTKQLQAAKPAGDLLPLYFLGRGHIPEALGAYNHWQLHGQSSRAQSAQSAALQQPVDALVNAAAALLPLPQRNVCITEGPGASEASWPARLLVGMSLQADGNIPVMHAMVQAGSTPPFMCSRLPVQPAKETPDTAVVATAASASQADAAELYQAPRQEEVVGGAGAGIINGHAGLDDWSMAVDAPGPSLFSLPFASGALSSSHMFEATPLAGIAPAPQAPLLFGQPARYGAVDARDPKRARTHSDAGL